MSPTISFNGSRTIIMSSIWKISTSEIQWMLFTVNFISIQCIHYAHRWLFFEMSFWWFVRCFTIFSLRNCLYFSTIGFNAERTSLKWLFWSWKLIIFILSYFHKNFELVKVFFRKKRKLKFGKVNKWQYGTTTLSRTTLIWMTRTELMLSSRMLSRMSLSIKY